MCENHFVKMTIKIHFVITQYGSTSQSELERVDLVIFARFYFLQISRSGQIREIKNLAKIITLIALLKKNENVRILNFVKKNPKIKNSRRFKHAKITSSTVVLNCNIAF